MAVDGWAVTFGTKRWAHPLGCMFVYSVETAKDTVIVAMECK